MIRLDQLTKIVEDNEVKEKLRMEKASSKEKEDFELEFKASIYNLEQRLIIAAEQNIRKLTIAHFSISRSGIFQTVSNELISMIRKSGNAYCAWRDKIITEKDVIKNMTGNLKRVYKYAESQGSDAEFFNLDEEGNDLDE
jgi:hypothetical protein